MKSTYKCIGIIILLIIVFLFGWCSKPKPEILPIPFKKPVNVDSIVKSARDQERELVMLEKINDRHDSIQKVYVVKWKEYKQANDTNKSVKPCISLCDSTLAAKDTLINSQRKLLAKKDTVIDTWKNVHKGDSTNYKAMEAHKDSIIINKDYEIKTQTRRKNFWKVIAGIATLANGVPR